MYCTCDSNLTSRSKFAFVGGWVWAPVLKVSKQLSKSERVERILIMRTCMHTYVCIRTYSRGVAVLFWYFVNCDVPVRQTNEASMRPVCAANCAAQAHYYFAKPINDENHASQFVQKYCTTDLLNGLRALTFRLPIHCEFGSFR